MQTTAQEKSYSFSLAIIRFVNGLDRKIYSNEVLGRQLIRCATSVGANIVEAQAGTTKKDFANFLTHALKSANESKYWLALLEDTNAHSAEILKLRDEAMGLSKILGASISTIRGTRKS
ncbi:MAG: four helix bundle protein [Candidatus Pacebacteria bacterium]|nr:four helix bundle protein [Candidatus Paceibacterota bacterium]